MKVLFKGLKEIRKRGCNCKGKVSTTSFSAIRSFNLPSGVKTFRKGQVYEVTDDDWGVLAYYTESFEVVT